MNERARITLTDILFLLIALVGLRAFYPVYIELLNQHSGAMDRGTELLLLTMLPVAILVLLGYIYLRAGVTAR